MADGINNPYSQTGPGSRATRSMDILRKTQPFESMLAVNTAGYLDVDVDADALRHSMDDTGRTRSSSSREWKVPLHNDVGGKGSVAHGLAVATFVASAEVGGVQVASAQRASCPNDHSIPTTHLTQPERQGAPHTRSDHPTKHSTASVLPKSLDINVVRSSVGVTSTAGRLQSRPGQGVGYSSIVVSIFILQCFASRF